MVRAIGKFLEWLFRRQGRESKGQAAPVDGLRMATAVALMLVAGGIAALWMRTRGRLRKPPVPDGGGGAAAVDLLDPAVAATDLPEAEWVRLAEEWMAKGDARMAMRAWYLGCLAVLHGRGLVSISRFKSNADYRREVGRRGRGIAGLEGEFRARVEGFEQAWYGLYPVDSGDAERFASGFARLRGMTL